MRALRKFVDQHNHWNSFFNGSQITFPLSQKDIDSIASSLDSALSPENLHCDGEISVAEANAKGNRLMHVVDDLEAYCTKNGFNMPTIYEAW
jgi:hypothetical protein